MTQLARLLLTIAMSMFITACGQTGGLYLPKSAPVAQQEGSQ